jgi:Zn-dependent M28 family amino/carboxypeptidase
MLAEELAPRDWAHPENLDRVADYVQAEFQASGGRVSEQRYRMAGHAYRNVIVSFGPDEGPRVVVGAHHDAFGSLPGADGNASGVAGLIELARLLGKREAELGKRVDLVSYTLEEPTTRHGDGLFRTPFGGSAVHVASLKESDVEVELAIVLEMIGCFSSEEGSQRYPSPVLECCYPPRGDFIAVVGRLGHGSAVRRVKRSLRAASPLPVESINSLPVVRGTDWSDHSNYWKAGHEAVMVTDTSFLRNARYHTVDDTPETLDYQRMARVVQGVHAAVMEASR